MLQNLPQTSCFLNLEDAANIALVLIIGDRKNRLLSEKAL